MIPRHARLAWQALLRFHDHKGPDRAAAVAYYTMLSLLPMLAFLISLGVAVFGSFERAYGATMMLVRGVVIHLDDSSLATLRTFVGGSVRFRWPAILLLAWTSKRIFSALFGALETVFEVPGRGFARGNLAALAMVLLVGAAMLGTLVLTTFVAAVEGFLRRSAMGAETFHSLTAYLLTHALPVAITLSFFFLLYRWGPRRGSLDTITALKGALLATVLWEGAKAAFAYYVRNIAHMKGLYGTLEGIIVLALWLEVSVSIILYCGEFVALLVGPRNSSPPNSGAQAKI